MSKFKFLMSKALWRTSMGIYELLNGKRPAGYIEWPNQNTQVAKITFKDGSCQYVIQKYDNLGQFLARYSYGTGKQAVRFDRWVNRTRSIAETLNL